MMHIKQELELHVPGVNVGVLDTPDAEPLQKPVSYIAEHLVYPILRGEEVTIGDLDFTRFDEDDLVEASRWCSLMADLFEPLNKLERILSGAAPSARRTAFF